MWTVEAPEYPIDVLGDLTPISVLYEFDGPRIFTARSRAGDLLLAYQCGEEDDLSRFLLVPSSESIVQRLQRGAMTVRAALEQPWGWLVETSGVSAATRAWKIDPSTLPADALPRQGTYLLASMMPMLSVRLVGDGLGSAGVPASVLRRAVDGVVSATRSLVQSALEMAKSTGRPAENVRRYYDLPAQAFAFNSFEIIFGDPRQAKQISFLDEEERVIQAVASLLRRGVEWAIGDGDITSGINHDLLDAVLRLAPPQHGIVVETHLQGMLVGARYPKILTRAATAKIRRAMKFLEQDMFPVRLTGLVREFDKDRLSFTLRTGDGATLNRCIFDELLYDDALAAFDSDAPVVVLGHASTSRGVVDVVSIASMSVPTSGSPTPSPTASGAT